MEENEEIKPSEQLVEQKPEKKGPVIVIVLLVLIALGVGGYICYDKYISKKPESNNKAKETNAQDLDEDKEVEETNNIYTISDVEKIFANNNEYFRHYEYKLLSEEYLQMLSKDALSKNIDILDILESLMKVENGKLYWYKNNSWVEDETIKSKINYLISDFDVLNSYRGVIVATEDKLYIIDNPSSSFDGFSDDEIALSWAKEWSKNVSYNIIELPGKLQEMQVKYASECEGWKIFQLKIDNKIYYLSYEDKIVAANEFVSSFDKVIGTCGYGSPKGILADGTLFNAVDSDNKKINIDIYMVFPKEGVEYFDIILVDNNKNLYMFNEELFENEKPVKLKAIQTIKDYEYGSDKKGEYGITNWFRLILSNNKTIETHD